MACVCVAAPVRAQPADAQFGSGELAGVPGTGDDAVQVLQLQPGVSEVFGQGLSIRGARVTDSKILVDGFEVPMLVHGNSNVATLPTEAMGEVDLSAGAFGVEVGRSTGGVIAIGSQQRFAGSATITPYSLTLAGGLVPYTDVLITGAIRGFYNPFRDNAIGLDMLVRRDLFASRAWRIAMSVFGAQDRVDGAYRATAAAVWHRGTWLGRIALSYLSTEHADDRNAFQHDRTHADGGTLRGELCHEITDLAGLRRVLWRSGVEVQATRDDLDLALPAERREGEPAIQAENLMDTTHAFHGIVWTPDLAAWSSLSVALAPDIRATAGVRVDAFVRTSDVVTQPRASLEWRFTPAITATLAAGAYRRPAEHGAELETTQLHAERATELVAGVRIKPTTGVAITASAYYTDRSHLIVHASDGTTLVNLGRGTDLGASVRAMYRDGQWTAWLGYGYLHATRIDAPYGRDRLADTDRPHQLELVALRRHGHTQIGARAELRSGAPTTAIAGAIYDADTDSYVPLFGVPNTVRMPLDATLGLRVDHHRAHWDGYLDVALSRRTIDYTYTDDYRQRTPVRYPWLLPFAGVRYTY